jgi:hypothetical protein
MSGLAVAGVAIIAFVAGGFVAVAIGIYSDMQELRRWEDEDQ